MSRMNDIEWKWICVSLLLSGFAIGMSVTTVLFKLFHA